MTVIGEQPHRVHVPERRRHIHRSWPCGHTDGGYMYGDGDDCRAADIIIEDAVAPPLYSACHHDGRSMTVESTHAETRVFAELEGDRRASYYTIPHPKGLR